MSKLENENKQRDEKIKKSKKDKAGKIFLLIWLPFVALVFSFQMAGHLLTMPIPENTIAVQKSLKKLTDSSKSQWYLFHVIYQNCSCANSLLKHLLERKSLPDASEHILYVGDDLQVEKLSTERGFNFHRMTNIDLKNIYQIEAAPMLAIMSENKVLEYLGGYYSSYGNYTSRDLEVFGKVRKSEPPKALPLFGCATSDRLKEAFDPLSLKLD